MYSWDEHKNNINKKKHGISFELGRSVFDDPLHIAYQDYTANNDLRWKVVGFTANGLLCMIVYMLKRVGGEDQIHIISVRRVTRSEIKKFEAHSTQITTQVLGHSASPNEKGWFGPGGYRDNKLHYKINKK